MMTALQPVLTEIPKSVSIVSWHRPNEASNPQKENKLYLSLYLPSPESLQGFLGAQ